MNAVRSRTDKTGLLVLCVKVQSTECRVPLMMLVREWRLKEGQRSEVSLSPSAASLCVYKVEVARARAGDDEARHFLVERRSRRSQRPGWSHEVDITTGTRFILPVPHALTLITIDVKRKIQPAEIVYFSSSLPADQSFKRHALVRGIVVPGAFIVSD